ncbi:NAD(P)-binding protein [Tothia fuscella]|uniref:NAD(P)-binding protein n=1 Tax=Tothia fuscella TaxID=1048955 RepID=A0A9P4NHQ2_9PEZI|nr:NAD(P)-binding protein [Tothia fuscella]
MSLWWYTALPTNTPDFKMSPTFTVDPKTLTNLRNKTIVITGGSSGIGLATAILISDISSTNNIAILDLHPPPPSLSIPQSRLLYKQCDITSWPSQRSAFQAVIDKFQKIDAVFVCAGISEYKDQIFTDEVDGEGLLKEPDRRVYRVDLDAATDSVKLAIYWMRRNGVDGGVIVMAASLAGYLGSAGAPLYSAAKHGIVGLLRSLKQETATLNIAISLIAPGITLTPILAVNREEEGSGAFSMDEWAKDMGSRGVPINTPESIASAVAYLINGGMSSNGKGMLIQNDRIGELESGIAKGRSQWMGAEMLKLFRGGRNAPLFSRVGAGSEGKSSKL